jgi:hypothetical protein
VVQSLFSNRENQAEPGETYIDISKDIKLNNHALTTKHKTTKSAFEKENFTSVISIDNWSKRDKDSLFKNSQVSTNGGGKFSTNLQRQLTNVHMR